MKTARFAAIISWLKRKTYKENFLLILPRKTIAIRSADFTFPLLQITNDLAATQVLQSLNKDGLSYLNSIAGKYDFSNGLNKTQWDIGDGTWNESNSILEPDNVVTNNGILSLQVHKDNPSALIPYSGGEIQSTQTYNSGQFTFSLQNETKPGTIGGAFLISPYQKDNWHQQEIDIEFLGDKPNGVQFNLHSIKHLPDGSTINETNNQFCKFINLDFDTSTGFHNYTINWSLNHDSISFLVDGVEKYKITDTTFIPTSNMEIRLNNWVVNNNPTWVGTLDPNDPNYVKSQLLVKKIEITNQNMLNANLASAIPLEILSLGFNFIGSTISGFLTQPINSLIIQPIQHAFSSVKTKKKQQPQQPMQQSRTKAITIISGISGSILGGVKGGIFAIQLGWPGILAGTAIGTVAGFFCGAGGYLLGCKIYQSLSKSLKSLKI